MVLISTVMAACGQARTDGPAPVLLAGLDENPGAGVVNVGPGDTVYEIARRYQLPMADIISLNGLQPPFELSVGARIQLPAPRDYTVKAGDSLFTVAQSFAFDQSQLARLNNLSAPFELTPGRTLRLPSPNTPAANQVAIVVAPRPATVTPEPLPPAAAPATAIATVAPQQPMRAIDRPFRWAPVPERKPGGTPRVVAQPQPTPASQPDPLIAPLPDARPSTTVTLSAPPVPPAPVVTVPPPVVAAPSPSVEPPRQQAERSPPPRQIARLSAPPPRTGQFQWPIVGRMVSTYGPKPGGLHNDGINVAAPKGTPVRAAERGVVAYAGNELRGFGNLLLIRHADGWMTAYAHLDRMLTIRGEVVEPGATIGTVGSTGNVDTPQLHFEIRRGSQALDPMLYLPRQTSALRN